MDRKTKIIATVGPSLSSEAKINSIIDSGANVLRINFSHGSLEDHENVIKFFDNDHDDLNFYILTEYFKG